jgi:hypothetical protein
VPKPVERPGRGAIWTRSRGANHEESGGARLNDGDPSTYYRGGAKGYVDYPLLDEAAAA